MKFFKIAAIFTMMMVLSLLSITPAIAGPPNHVSLECEGPNCEAEGYLGVGVAAGNIGFDADGKIINNGAAGSVAVGVGGTAGLAAGYVNNGTVSGVTSVVGGGAAGAKDYEVNIGKGIEGVQGVKVGSQAAAAAQTGGSMDLAVNPDGHYVIDAYGLAGGFAGGVAAQGTLSGSIIAPSDKFKSQGISLGVAGQGSVGAWSGSAYVESLGDIAYDKTTVTYEGGEDGGPGYYWKYKNPNKHWMGKDYKYFPNGHPAGNSEWNFLGAERIETVDHKILMDSNAGAGFEANIFMSGSTYSESYRYIDKSQEGVRTEGFGTNVGAVTNVTSFGSKYEVSNGLANAGAGVEGGYVVGGGAASLTVQDGAIAGAVGSYHGSGDLGCNFDGSAIGFTSTSVTTFEGMNGSINSASAGMEVSAQTHENNQQ